MKRIIIEVEDSANEPVVAMLKLCNGVKIVSVQESIDVIDDRDACMRYAINTLRNNKVFIHNYDYAWIMMAINEGHVDEFDAFKSRAYSKTIELFPDWIFLDVNEAGEILRRKNVVKQFLSAYNKAKRGFCNKNCNN